MAALTIEIMKRQNTTAMDAAELRVHLAGLRRQLADMTSAIAALERLAALREPARVVPIDSRKPRAAA